MRTSRIVVAWMAASVVVASCGNNVAQPEPSGAPRLESTALKYRLDERFAPIFFCDPDFYPVGSEEGERTNADEWWRTVDRAGEEVSTILDHLGITSDPDDEQVLSAYREHKRLLAIGLEESGSSRQFDLRSGVETDAAQITGTITESGTIAVAASEPANTACPICLAAGTLIATPHGPIAVHDLRVGDPIWTTSLDGGRLRGHVLRVALVRQETPVLLLRLRLADGRNLTASAAHPAVDGQLLGALRPGDLLDGSVIETISIVAPTVRATFDVLPSGPTGTYRANGVLLSSTL